MASRKTQIFFALTWYFSRSWYASWIRVRSWLFSPSYSLPTKPISLRISLKSTYYTFACELVGTLRCSITPKYSLINFWATYFSLFKFTCLYCLAGPNDWTIYLAFSCLLNASLYSKLSIGIFLVSLFDLSVIFGWNSYWNCWLS